MLTLIFKARKYNTIIIQLQVNYIVTIIIVNLQFNFVNCLARTGFGPPSENKLPKTNC